jgi:hypothetical protein
MLNQNELLEIVRGDLKVKLLKPTEDERYHRFTVLRESGYEWDDLLSEPVDSMIPVAMPQEVKLKTLTCLMNQVYPLVAKPVDLLEACKRFATFTPEALCN